MLNSKKKIIKSCICLIILTLILICAIATEITKSPINLIKSKLNLEFSDSIDIIYYEHDNFDGFDYVDSIYAKFRISENDKNNIICQLENNHLPKYESESSSMPHFNNLYDWFSFSKDEINYLYHSYRTDHKFNDKHDHDIWIIITFENNAYFMYIAF